MGREERVSVQKALVSHVTNSCYRNCNTVEKSIKIEGLASFFHEGETADSPTGWEVDLNRCPDPHGCSSLTHDGLCSDPPAQPTQTGSYQSAGN